MAIQALFNQILSLRVELHFIVTTHSPSTATESIFAHILSANHILWRENFISRFPSFVEVNHTRCDSWRDIREYWKVSCWRVRNFFIDSVKYEADTRQSLHKIVFIATVFVEFSEYFWNTLRNISGVPFNLEIISALRILHKHISMQAIIKLNLINNNSSHAATEMTNLLMKSGYNELCKRNKTEIVQGIKMFEIHVLSCRKD